MRSGEDARLRKREASDNRPGEPGHKLAPVYVEMLLQICRDYPGLPDPRTLTMAEIRFFYSGMRAELKQHTSPEKKKAPKPSITKPRRRR